VVVNASEGDVVERVKEATGGLGVEFAVEASGVTSVLATAWASLANVRLLFVVIERQELTFSSFRNPVRTLLLVRFSLSPPPLRTYRADVCSHSVGVPGHGVMAPLACASPSHPCPSLSYQT
jgi:hypothetical protein